MGQAWRLKMACRCELCKALQGLETKQLKSFIAGLKISFVFNYYDHSNAPPYSA